MTSQVFHSHGSSGRDRLLATFHATDVLYRNVKLIGQSLLRPADTAIRVWHRETDFLHSLGVIEKALQVLCCLFARGEAWTTPIMGRVIDVIEIPILRTVIGIAITGAA